MQEYFLGLCLLRRFILKCRVKFWGLIRCKKSYENRILFIKKVWYDYFFLLGDYLTYFYIFILKFSQIEGHFLQ
jgi:hypothetical protein